MFAGVEPDERADAAVVPQAAGFERSADGAGFAAVLVDDDVGLDLLTLEAALDEIDLALHGGQIVLRAALEQEAGADGGEVGDLRDVQPDVLGQHVAQAGHDLFRLPALALEIDDIALHEHGAAVAEAGEAAGGKRRIRVL